LTCFVSSKSLLLIWWNCNFFLQSLKSLIRYDCNTRLKPSFFQLYYIFIVQFSKNNWEKSLKTRQYRFAICAVSKHKFVHSLWEC